MVVRVLDDPDHYVLVLAGGGEQLAAVGELHAPDGAEVRRLQLLRELDILKVEGTALVRLDPLEAQGVVPALGVGGLEMEFELCSVALVFRVPRSAYSCEILNYSNIWQSSELIYLDVGGKPA